VEAVGGRGAGGNRTARSYLVRQFHIRKKGKKRGYGPQKDAERPGQMKIHGRNTNFKRKVTPQLEGEGGWRPKKGNEEGPVVELLRRKGRRRENCSRASNGSAREKEAASMNRPGKEEGGKTL